jgi:Domain of unknown function (DUF4328)
MRVKTTPSIVASPQGGRRERESGSLASLRWRTALVTACLLAYVPCLLAAAWAGIMLLPGAGDAAAWGPLGQPHFLKVVLGVYGGVFLLAILGFCLWLWRAAKTVRRLGVTMSVDRPGMAVMYFFVPIAWWFKPYATVRTIWQVAMDPNDWDNVAISQTLPLWWIMWIAQWVALGAVIGIETIVMGAEKRFLETIAIWIFAGCGVVATLSLLAVILQISGGLRRQLRNRQPIPAQ